MTDTVKQSTLLTHAASDPDKYQGMVNPPVHRGSTIVFKSFADFENLDTMPFHYGRAGTPTSAAFEEAVAAIEGAAGAISGSSGLSVITAVMTAFVDAGDHMLMSDSVYGPTRKYAEQVLRRFGVDVEFFDPMVADITALFRDTTKVVFMEAPASLTYEVQDIGTIAKAARARGIKTVMDNSWGTPVFFKPLDHGIDVSVMSGTKYIGGHSDLLLGVAAANADCYPLIKKSALLLGVCGGSEELYLGLRGLRTLHVRMKAHEAAALDVAHWLLDHPAVACVNHPALPSARGHTNWKKYFSGSSGTFSILLKQTDREKIGRALDSLKLLRIGFSWGGFESLVFPEQPTRVRSAVPWCADDGFNLRLHIGLEDVEDLKADLAQAFAHLA